MIIRIVKMIFREEEIESFKSLFDERKSMIANFPGCQQVELWQDKAHPQIFFTYSWWLSEEHLDSYRASPFFNDTWTKTKRKFAAKPEAWTVDRLYQSSVTNGL